MRRFIIRRPGVAHGYAVRVAALSLVALIAACSSPPEIGSPLGLCDCVAGLEDSSADFSAETQDPAAVRRRMHRLRNMKAMVELVSALPQGERPRTIVYLASGDHLAPLGLCDLLPTGQGCRLIYTEIDAAVQHTIGEGLADLDKRSCLDLLDPGSEIRGVFGHRVWKMIAGGRTVSIELRVTDPRDSKATGLVNPALLSEADLVISHDWSGEPIGNLQVIRQFVDAARLVDGLPPLLMIEDLEHHLYPVDLAPFGRRAAVSGAYGHRGSDKGPGRHGIVELGEPIFGGGVLLDFSDPWWRRIEDAALTAFFDFLLLNQFDVDRRNVLTGGPEPLVAPMLLDWWTGYGARGVDGKPIEPGTASRVRMIDAALQVADVCGPALRRRIACRLRLYSLLLGIRAAGDDTIDLMPGDTVSSDPSALASPDMERLYRQALRRAGDFRAEREAFAQVARELLRFLGQERAVEVLDLCPVGPHVEPEKQASHLRSAYCDLVVSMQSRPVANP